MKQKKAMIQELTQSVWSILAEFHEEELAGKWTRSEAQEQVLAIFQKLRYGDENKDYYWITDMEPRMVIHPYRPDLNGQDLKNYRDPKGKLLFVEGVRTVMQADEGYIDYFWQWKDDSSRVVPKLSFIKGFKPWGWIVGTGIYLEDVHLEINRLKNRLSWVSLIIILAVSAILFFIVRTSLMTEKKRQEAEGKLKHSRARYRSLVEASTESTLLSLNGKISYINPFFLDAFGYNQADLTGQSPESLFAKGSKDALNTYRKFLSSGDQYLQLEADWLTADQQLKSVIVAISRIEINQEKGCIFVPKELRKTQKMSRQIDELEEELQTSLLFMNQPVKHMAHSPLSTFMDTSIKECAQLLTKKKQNGVLIRGQKGEYLGIVTDHDLRERVTAEDLSTEAAVYNTMTSPLIVIPEHALVFEALLLLNEKQISHIGIKDNFGQVVGLLSYEDLLSIQQNSTAFIMRQIQYAQDTDDLIRFSHKTVGIVQVLEQSGAKSNNITRIMARVADALCRRFIELAIQETDHPPCDFAFLALGSEGRGEQTLATDQDNAIIFADPHAESYDSVQKYFTTLGAKVNHWLDQAGYAFCIGEVMARNTKWCHSQSTWKKQFAQWINNPQPDAVLNSSIFLDFRCVYGNEAFVRQLADHVRTLFVESPAFFFHLGQEMLRFKTGGEHIKQVTITDPNGIEGIDLKKQIFLITGFARLYGLQNDINERHSLSRLNLLLKKQIIKADFHDQIVASYHFLMQLRFRTQLQQLAQNQKTDNFIPLSLLSELEKGQFKKVLLTLTAIHRKIKIDFNL